MHFPDVNVWFALFVTEHRHHERAVSWWEECTEQVLFCRQTQLGLMRLLTTSAAMNGKPLSMTQAWAAFDRLAGDARVSWVVEPAALDAAFRRSSGLSESAPKLWTDAYLQAFAATIGATIVTMDRAMAGRAGNVVLLS